MKTRFLALLLRGGLLLALLTAACGGSAGATPHAGEVPTAAATVFLPLMTATTAVSPPPASGGHVYYTLADDGHLYRLDVDAPQSPRDISLQLASLAAGSDEWANVSPDGAWVLLSTERAFDEECDGWACLALLPADLSQAEVLRAPRGVVHADSFSAVASGGGLVVYPANDGPHALDLWAVRRQAEGWSAPLLLTGDSPYDAHTQPALSADGSKVVFDCDPDMQDGQEGTAICEVGTDGSNFRTVLAPADGPGGSASNALHHPDYAPDGSIIFEADWEGEQIWQLETGSEKPQRVTAAFNNDNSPCALPDGRIVSLWLDRPEGAGSHELKIMSADGSDYFMALTEKDVFDIGLGCGE